MSKSLTITRRDLLKLSAAGAGVAFLGQIPGLCQALEQAITTGKIELFEASAENQIYSVCLQCNTGCAVKVKILNGLAAKIDGNPYSPWTLWPHPAFTTSVKEMATVEGALCPKGQAGLQSAYDPYRVMSVLKRKPGSKRGEGKWQTITFEKAMDEITNGGDLFGEGHVDGLKAVRALTDADVAAKLDSAIKKFWDEKDLEKKKALREAIAIDFKEHLQALIDPQRPDLGPKNNQFMFVWGRMKGGREDLVHRFVQEAFGSINMNGHTTVCQGSLYFTGKSMSAKWNPEKGEFDSGDKFYWQADTGNSEFVIYAGNNLFDANYGPPQRVPKATQAIVDGNKFAVIDPRCSKLAAKAWKWVPVKPGMDAAFAMAMLRWIFDNTKYNKSYLEIANKSAAKAADEPNYCNASWLVKLDGSGNPVKFLRASEIGLISPVSEQDSSGKTVTRYVDEAGTKYPGDVPVVLVDGKARAFDPVDEKATPVRGDLLVETTIDGKHVKSSLQLLKDEAFKNTVAEWAKLAGVEVADVVALSKEFTSHGRKAVIDLHRGPSQHTNGFYNNNAYYVLNLLIGNFDYAGGTIKASTYDRKGGKKGQPFAIEKMFGQHHFKASGIDMLRTKVAYEKTSLFDGSYPTKRPWYPVATDVYQEDWPSIGDAYPYPIKILMTYMCGAVYSLPASQTIIDILSDTKKLPLHIASDILIGETSSYADYIFPDLSYLERWEFHGSHPSVPWKVENIRQPAMSLPGWPTVKVFGEEIPMSFEALFLGIAERLQLPGFGPNGFAEGLPFTRPEHQYLKQVANIAFGEKEDGSDSVPEADDEEMKIFAAARRHLPKSVFDPTVWKAAVKNDEKLWRKVVYVLNRGGRYEEFSKGYKGEKVAHPYGRLISIFQEKTAKSINTMTGKNMVGLPAYIPPGCDYLGQEIRDEGFDFNLITFKTITMTKARTISNYWLLAVQGEGYVLMNSSDAGKLGIQHGDMVKLLSASNPKGMLDVKGNRQLMIAGKAYVTEGLRPGVVAFPHGFGHWGSGAGEVEINGKIIAADQRRTTPLHGNSVMRVDPVTKNVGLSDIIGGSSVFYDTKVKVVRV